MCDTDIELPPLLDNVSTAILLVDESLKIRYANHAGLALFETGFRQLYNLKLEEFFLVLELYVDL